MKYSIFALLLALTWPAQILYGNSKQKKPESSKQQLKIAIPSTQREWDSKFKKHDEAVSFPPEKRLYDEAAMNRYIATICKIIFMDNKAAYTRCYQEAMDCAPKQALNKLNSLLTSDELSQLYSDSLINLNSIDPPTSLFCYQPHVPQLTQLCIEIAKRCINPHDAMDYIEKSIKRYKPGNTAIDRHLYVEISRIQSQIVPILKQIRLTESQRRTAVIATLPLQDAKIRILRQMCYGDIE